MHPVFEPTTPRVWDMGQPMLGPAPEGGNHVTPEACSMGKGRAWNGFVPGGDDGTLPCDTIQMRPGGSKAVHPSHCLSQDASGESGSCSGRSDTGAQSLRAELA